MLKIITIIAAIIMAIKWVNSILDGGILDAISNGFVILVLAALGRFYF